MYVRHCDTFEKLGFPLDLSNPVFFLEKVNFNRKKSFQLLDIKTQKWIGIAPFAQYDAKVYPLDLMQASHK